MKYDTLDDAIALATFAHRKQRDQAGRPFIDHPLRVLQRAQNRGAAPYILIAAALHDVVEDTPYTIPMLQALGVGPAPLHLVEILTFDPTRETREEYIQRIIAGGPDAINLKLDDIGDNTEEWRLAYLPPAKQEHLRSKYFFDRAALLGV